MVGIFLIQLVITLTITGVCFMMIYGYAEEKKRWVQQEKAFHQHRQDWSMQSLVVLNSFLMTLSQFSIDTLMDESAILIT